jgi:hypothetical protein
MIFKLSLPSVGKKHSTKSSLSSVVFVTLGVFSFTEGFLRDTQRALCGVSNKKHSAKNLTLGKEPNSGSEEIMID